MSWYLTVRKLKDILAKYDDNAVVMIAENRDGDGAVEADDSPSYVYRNDEGEIVDEFDPSLDESMIRNQRAVIIWGADK